MVAKDEFIEINLELIAAHTVMGSDQSLLEVANRPVRQRHDRLRAFPQFDPQRLAARHVLKARLLQSAEAFEAVGIYRATGCHILF